MNLIDLGLFIVLAVGFLGGIGLGFIRITLPFAAAVATWISLRYQPEVGLWLESNFDLDPALGELLAYLAVVLGALLLTAIVGSLLRFFITITLTGWLDRLAGAAAGVVVGAGLGALLITALEAFGGAGIQGMLGESALAGPLRDLWALGLRELGKYEP